MAHQFTKEHLILHAVWRKAFNDGQLTIPVKSASDATRLRFSLYNAVRPVREGKVVAPDLLQAVQECSVRIEGLSVVVQLKANTELMQAISDALGGVEGLEAAAEVIPTSAEAQAVEESQRKLLEKLGQDAAPTRSTPYYTR